MPFWDARCWPVSEETRSLQQDCVRRARAGEFVRCDFEIYGEAHRATMIVIDFSLAPLHDSRGEIVFLLAEGRNIADKKQAEAEVAKKNEELRGLLEELPGWISLRPISLLT
jgi:PAS domain-containing protein